MSAPMGAGYSMESRYESYMNGSLNCTERSRHWTRDRRIRGSGCVDSFRHSLATNLRSLGVDVKVALKLLRHGDSHTTMNL
jgi:hypothetical protein